MIIRCVVLLNRRRLGLVRSVRKGGVSGRVVADLRVPIFDEVGFP
jgi:hypothetical protein